MGAEVSLSTAPWGWRKSGASSSHPGLCPQEPLVSHFGSGTSSKVSPSPALWQLLWVRSALNGLSSPSGDHVPRMRWAGRGWSPGARDEVRKGTREDWIPQFVFGGSGSSGPGWPLRGGGRRGAAQRGRPAVGRVVRCLSMLLMS